MPVIKLQHVVSCSSEDTTHKADNLLKPETYRKWKCAENAERHASVILQFEKATQIQSIDVGNESSAFVEMLVGHSTSTNDDYQVILVTSSFMSPMDSKNGINTNRVRMFGPDKLSKAVLDKNWDRVKIICSQPFNKFVSYGLSFIKFHSPPDPEDTNASSASGSQQSQSTSKLGMFKLKDDSKASTIAPGSFFKQQSSVKTEPSPLTGAAAVRAAATLAAASLTTSVTTSKPATTPTLLNQEKPKVAPSSSSTRDEHSDKRDDTRNNTTQKPTQKRRLSSEDENASERRDTKKAATRRNDTDREEARTKAPPTKRSRDETSKTKKSKPFEQLMEEVTFVLSGFQNPLRGDLREKAMEMGAKYRPDWGSGCTHLICAFANTPKFTQVKNKGTIVTKAWILDSYKKKSLQSWRRYSMLSTSDDSSSYEAESENEDSEDDWEPRRKKRSPQKATPKKAMPKTATPKRDTPSNNTPTDASENRDTGVSSTSDKPSTSAISAAVEDDDCSTTDIDSDGDDRAAVRAPSSRKQDKVSSGGDTEDEIRRIREKEALPSKATSKNNYDSSTDEEAATQPEGPAPAPSSIPDLPEFFADKVFFLYGKFDSEERRQIMRLIVTFDGTVEDYMNDEVSFVITNSKWDENFDKALSDHSGLSFVRPKWIYVCSEKSKMVPYQPYVIVPR